MQEAPVINNRKVQSFVRVANNTPFIVGGLISRKKSEVTGGIPFLSTIPFFGRLFSSSTVETIRKEVIVVIKPHIISEEGANFSRVVPLDSETFNAFGNKLFQNSYRVQNADVYDLSFIGESPIFKDMLIKLFFSSTLVTLPSSKFTSDLLVRISVCLSSINICAFGLLLI